MARVRQRTASRNPRLRTRGVGLYAARPAIAESPAPRLAPRGRTGGLVAALEMSEASTIVARMAHFDWRTSTEMRPWSDLDGPTLAAVAGGLQLIDTNQSHMLKLHVLASIAIGLDRKPDATPLDGEQIERLVLRPELQDPEGTGEYQITDLFCSEIELQGVPFRFLAGLGSASDRKLEYLASAILNMAGKDLPRNFLKAASDLIAAVAQLSEAMCNRAGVERTLVLQEKADGELVVPAPSRLRRLMRAVSFPLDVFEPEVVDVLGRIASHPGERQLVYPTEASDAVTLRPLLITDSQLIIACPNELATALCAEIQKMAHDFGCVQDLVLAHRSYISDFVRHVATAGQINFGQVSSFPELFLNMIVGEHQGQKIYICVANDTLSNYDPAQPFAMWFASPPTEALSRLIQLEDQYPPVVVFATVTSTRGLAAFGPNLEGAFWLNLDVVDLVTLLKLKWADNPWDLTRFARAVEKFSTETSVMSESLLGEYGLYDDNRQSFYLSDDALPTGIVIGGEYALKYRLDERQRFDEHLVLTDGGALRAISQSGTKFAPIYYLQDSMPALSVEFEEYFIWIRARANEGDAPAVEFLEGTAYWLWQILSNLDASISKRALRVLVTVSMDHRGAPIVVQRASEDQFHVVVRPAVAFETRPEDNDFDRSFVMALVDGIFATLVDGELDATALVERVAPRGDKRMFLIGSNRIPELHDPEVAALARTVPDSVSADVLDELGSQLFRQTRLALGDIPEGQTTDVLNSAVSILYRRLAEKITQYDSSDLLSRFMGHSAGLEVVTRLDRLRRRTRIACYGPELYPPSVLREEATQKTEASLAARFLVEMLSATSPRTGRSPNDDEYDSLVALAVEIVLKGMQSDASHYGLSDVRVSRLGSGRLGTSREDRWATGLVRHSELAIAHDLQGAPDPDDRRDPWQFDAVEDVAFSAEYGFTVREMQEGLVGLYDHAPRHHENSAVVSMKLTDAVAVVRQRTDWSEARSSSLLALFTLSQLQNFDLVPETYPWRFGRDRSYLRQPLVATGEGAETLLRWSPARLLESVGDLIELYRSGRLKASSKEMRVALGSVRQASNNEFEHKVAELLRAVGFEKVFERVEAWEGRSLTSTAGAKLGDIDVLVIDHGRRRIIVIEAKDFETARTPIEMSREMRKLREEAVKKSHKRAEWVREHLHLFASPSRHTWTVEELVVTSRPSTAAATGNGHVSVIAFQDLKTHILESA